MCLQVCDQPHPTIVRDMLSACARGDLQAAYGSMKSLCDMGYSAVDIISTVFKVREAFFLGPCSLAGAPSNNCYWPAVLLPKEPGCMTIGMSPKPAKSWQLGYTTIGPEVSVVGVVVCVAAVVQVARTADIGEWTKLEFLKEIGFCHMRIGDGVNSRLQLSGMLAKLCTCALNATK